MEDPNEWLNPNNTVWKYNECITQQDLKEAINVLFQVYDTMPDGFEKDNLALSIRTIDVLFMWVQNGKPSNMDYLF